MRLCDLHKVPIPNIKLPEETNIQATNLTQLVMVPYFLTCPNHTYFFKIWVYLTNTSLLVYLKQQN